MHSDRFVWSSTTLTHPGKIRKANEDACLDRPDARMWLVADGMGGHQEGGYASGIVVRALEGLPPSDSMAEYAQAAEHRLHEANRFLYERASRRPLPTTIGSTVAMLVACGGECTILWAGDSRCYRLRDDRLRLLSRDHTQVEDLVMLGEITRAEAERHPRSNIITRAVGGSERLRVDQSRHDLVHGDRFLLCSDGLNKDVSDAEIAALIGVGKPKDAARSLLDLALSRKASDNITVAVIEFKVARVPVAGPIGQT